MNITCWGFLILFECAAPAPKPPVIICPETPAWSRDYQAKLALEIEAMPNGTALEQAAREHIMLRDKLRKCRSRP